MLTPLGTVRRRASETRESQRKLKTAILDAHKTGATLREIAKAADMSHEKVRGLIRQDQA